MPINLFHNSAVCIMMQKIANCAKHYVYL